MKNVLSPSSLTKINANAAVNPLFAIAPTSDRHASYDAVVDPNPNVIYNAIATDIATPKYVACNAYPVVGDSASSRTNFMNSKSHDSLGFSASHSSSPSPSAARTSDECRLCAPCVRAYRASVRESATTRVAAPTLGNPRDDENLARTVRRASPRAAARGVGCANESDVRDGAAYMAATRAVARDGVCGWNRLRWCGADWTRSVDTFYPSRVARVDDGACVTTTRTVTLEIQRMRK
mmetsp:Transcript_7188/g.23776  ORF Transcript_7188/g.23776 Transcript_7188/m.23776 type:complete len:236 (-) Transcript_7188:2415-3122(-)